MKLIAGAVFARGEYEQPFTGGERDVGKRPEIELVFLVGEVPAFEGNGFRASILQLDPVGEFPVGITDASLILGTDL